MSPLHHLLRKHATALLKAGSYYGVHIVVAAAVAYARHRQLAGGPDAEPAGALGPGRGLLPARQGLGPGADRHATAPC